ncbi:Retrovirus-related Pol polyprotein from transposon 17.6, partial [Mucuna pruriens]
MLLRIDDMIDKLRTKVKEGDMHNITFRMCYGHYEYVVMPFNVTNALVVFIDYVNWIFHPFLNKLVVIFINGILVYSCTREEHEERVRVMVEVLKKKKKLYDKLLKCKFLLDKVNFFGHVIPT